ncbi:hypothetical protein TVAG_033400 [Trichomonas vaginalis G3]|uniref:DUF3447 domain-containing protein n=1 Tax=Trichomonas vaginalis (strain ATCC PRA-98 / G3) TaxID=412133 RepID=A2FJ05_TRIV3|nr:proteasome regulatory particle assembly [Trichomonas vaginalis G3]EAX95120.1 hypothetical protein TVAG_033400 [Trichomonas vaginalis G3]KAI5524609.1 proteasome regulatory particle assembly [Trichomonas vaginalis G3]|eukprot:XP_001308050.1 hypothetical protein [Trichomonas vaginalis G3]
MNKYNFSIAYILTTIYKALLLRDRYMKAYLQLYDLINSLVNYKYKFQPIIDIKDIISAFENNENTEDYEFPEHLIPNSIFNAIMNDDITALIHIIDQDDSVLKNSIKKRLFNIDFELDLLDACSYYGSEKCYLYLQENNKFKPSNVSIAFSFLGGNPRIIKESLPLINDSNLKLCFESIIASHNIDFLMYLDNNFDLANMKHMNYIQNYSNLEALFLFTNNGKIDEFDNSLLQFNVDDLILYFIKKFGESTIYQFNILEAIKHRMLKTVKYAIDCGINCKEWNDYHKSILHFAAEYDMKEIVQLLISKGDINLSRNVADIYLLSGDATLSSVTL